MRPKPELDPELMSCPKPRQGRAARRGIGWLLTVTALGVLGAWSPRRNGSDRGLDPRDWERRDPAYSSSGPEP